MRRCAAPCLLLLVLLVKAEAETKPHLKSWERWRLSAPGRGYPVGTEVLKPWQVVRDWDSDAAIAIFDEKGTGGGLPVEPVHDVELEDFLRRTTPPEGPWGNRPADRCKHGRFLLNDPRVGLFHNQRHSYEAALAVARALGRTLVIPGFFKFPHPHPFDGFEWVPASRLFDWDYLTRCYDDVVELGDLMRECGPAVLDRHVTVPFLVDWMAEGTAWVNGTRRSLRWAPPDGSDAAVAPGPGARSPGGLVRLRSARTQPEVRIELNEPISWLLQYFLVPKVAEARTVRVHGLMVAPRGNAEDDPLCLLPAPDIRAEARAFVMSIGAEGTLGLHMRIFKRGNRSAGAGPAVVDKAGNLDPVAEETCKLDGMTFAYLCIVSLHANHRWFLPSHTIVATNEGDRRALWQSTVLMGFSGVVPLSWVYSLDQYTAAVTVDECTHALRSILFECMVIASTDRYAGNMCSSMSHYIHRIRVSWFKFPADHTVMVGGKMQTSLIRGARNIVKDLIV